ncbi:uncharacterized protein si:ch211-119e14.1 [Thalassophryne amazonica]|uniref:uncharacterized protein si:ch211-119e14.1 n=1 Tax=Thalassophryne amazonica TaxID=390379 RepID=UPI0014711AD5|nr:uncharacterized protein si:ch211-119e14.1 [Thalassophryne amazonica]XP_034020845.1 uncharacterized protein si:ch211-119e14.1 [Thalassophryne amazonica]XP_034020846.1 uncharacterized protein si:ch211-119e14.1 [Thalassophryne amazonica]
MPEDKVMSTSSTHIVLILFFFLVFLIVVLIILYKKLNRETNGEYTIRRMVYKEGGIRDWMRGSIMVLETHLGVRLWPRGDENSDGEEVEEMQDEEKKVENRSPRSSTKGAEQEENGVAVCGEMKGDKGDTSDDTSSLESLNAEEQTKLVNQPEMEGETEEMGEQVEEKDKGEVSGGTGLLIDLKQFSGSAIWSEENKEEGKDSDVTAL